MLDMTTMDMNAVTLNVRDEMVFQHEHPLSIVSPQTVSRPIGSQKVVHSRCFPLPKWKQSIKYVHMNIVRKIEVIGTLETDRTIGETNTVFMDTTEANLNDNSMESA
ncbi:hypothetical protein NECAME_12091 [Necator americanus]|uniref:Uncharacterized protein n=1 Tax=Necator americanus TaxID=51031 RepID=W2T4D4_NECAM|nr:hypothetical protein NECAME_12091 [Necator americanus]ETN75812.1 hypothetical protein NECAME_12091 [Necator americanus]